jgi:cytochrome c-type biogenesis protein CcmE
MLVRVLFLLLIVIPYFLGVQDRPIWLTAIVVGAAAVLSHVVALLVANARSERTQKLVKIGLSAAVILIAGGLLIRSSIAEADYYKHVNEVTAQPDRWVAKRLKVHGFVEAGSIEEKIVDQDTVRTFVLEYQGERIRVRHKGPKPDTFRDLAEVVAQGRLGREGDEYVLDATELMAKCPSKYEQDQRSRAQPRAAAADGTR